eukprot:5145845-Pyramimonas_sp.AAC.1
MLVLSPPGGAGPPAVRPCAQLGGARGWRIARSAGAAPSGPPCSCPSSPSSASSSSSSPLNSF